MTRSETLPPGRIEAFSDGVIAVAITLLVLDLTVPDPKGTGSLGEGLLSEWPSYLAYVVSFIAIGIFWLNHHTMLRRLTKVDHSILVLNIFLLMCIVALPFTASLLATYLNRPEGGHLAALIYAASLFVTSTLFFLMQCHIMLNRRNLLRHPPTASQVRWILVRAALALPAYLVAGLLGLLSPYLTLAVCVILGIFYLLAPPSMSSPKTRWPSAANATDGHHVVSVGSAVVTRRQPSRSCVNRRCPAQ